MRICGSGNVRILIFCLIVFCSAVFASGASHALAHEPDGTQCARLTSDEERLSCYDLLFRVTQETVTPPGDTGKWRIVSETSKIDDSQNVFIRLKSTDTFTERYREPRHVTLHLQCRESTTYAYFYFGGAFMAGYDGKDTVTLRIDKQNAFTMTLSESSDNEALGHFSGRKSIPFIKRLYDSESLLLRFAPYNESSSIVTFPIAGLREAIKPLQKACNWKP